MKKKIIIIVFSVLLAAGIVGTFWGPSIAEAATGVWNSCPFGEVNDTYPGDCHNYIDTNRDNICDRSQPNPQSSVTSETSAGILPADSSAAIADSGDSDPAAGAGTSSAVATGNNHSYNFLPIFAVVVVLYSITWILSARKIMKNTLHRKIWNVVLLITLVVSAFLGIIRILSIDFNIDVSLPFNTLFWHVEASIVLGIVSLFHIIWHWRYYATMLRIAKSRGS